MLKSSDAAKKTSNILGKIFAWVPLHPTAITLLSLILAILAYLVFNPFDNIAKYYSLSLFLLAFFFDAVDGAVAREKNLVSKKGAFLDGISDRLVEFFLILALFKSVIDPTIQLLLLVVLFFGTVMTAFVKAYAEHSEIMKHNEALCMPGILERTERSILLLLALIFFLFGYSNLFLTDLFLTAVLSIITFVHRVHYTYHNAEA